MEVEADWQIKPGQQMGRNEASIEMFKKGAEGAVSALVRENVQNSLDVVKDKSKPVRMTFKIGFVDRIPGQEHLSEIYNKIKNSEPWNGAYDEGVEKIQKILSRNRISVLKVSDYNTVGAEGASTYDEYGPGTSWKAMTEVNGQTLKSQADSAGSFGIGKNSNRAVTPLQAMYFTSLTERDLNPYSQGWMIYASIVDRYGTPPVSGNSFFYKTNDNKPILGELPEFSELGTRIETGTDIFIPGVEVTPELPETIKTALLENFLVSIEMDKLEVTIDNQGAVETINSDNLGDYVAAEKSDEIAGYYAALKQTNPEFIFTMDDFEYKGQKLVQTGDVVFKVHQSEDLKGTRKAMLTRGIGMKINNYPEKGRAFPQGIDFTAVLLVVGTKANELLHNIENPEHTSWNNKDKLKNYPDAKKLFDELKAFMRGSVESLLPEVSDEIVAYGLEDLLVDPSLESGDKVDDKLPVNISKVEVKETVKPISRKRSKGYVGAGETGEGVPKPKDNGGQSDPKTPNPGLQRNPVSTGGDGEEFIDVTPYMSSVRSKTVNAIHSVELYPDVSISNPEMVFEIVGDSSTDTKFEINNPSISKDGIGIDATNNTITLRSNEVTFEAGEPIVVSFETDVEGDVSFNIKVIGKVSHED